MTSKGMMHTLEAVIVLAMLLIAAATIFRPINVDDKSTALVKTGYAALQYLDYTGSLRPSVISGDVQSIKNGLQQWLTNFEVEICNPVCSGTNQQGAIAVDYFIAGHQSFQPTHVRLYLW